MFRSFIMFTYVVYVFRLYIRAISVKYVVDLSRVYMSFIHSFYIFRLFILFIYFACLFRLYTLLYSVYIVR